MTSAITQLPAKLVQRASTFAANIGTAKQNGPSASKEDGHSSLISDFREQIRSGLPAALDFSVLAGVVDALRHNNAIDDRKMLLEHLLVFLSRLPEGPFQTKLQNAVVELLYNDLPHPPATYIGDKYAWRCADGSHNNISDPDMGKAGMPYARSVQQSNPLPRNQLPDAGLVFDTLLKREKFVKHPAGLSSMMFSFAALVIHTVFRTSHEDVNINETSSYVDLSPLYGHNQEAQDKVRTRNGRGTLHPDSFAEDRLLLLPPAVCVILVLFNRNHNYIAKKLLEINERGTYKDPDTIPSDDPTRDATLLAQEESIFQTARLINCTWFASAVFSDYFSAILGLVRQGNSWSLNPFGEIRQEDHTLFERGRGNVCSVEFNCLYRWHATTSMEDEQWVHQVFAKIFPGKQPDELTVQDFKAKAKELHATDPDVTHWTFGGLQRQEDGSFKDAELAAVLHNATDHAAGAFKARGTPHIMRLHEIMGIEQNRRWGVCSLNDFRKFLGLKPYSSFIEWNSNPEVAAAAEKLYGDINTLELYVGLQAEEAKPVVDGAGLCPSYTISRAILSDAIALTRGDRFYTADYTPFNMTAWGFQDCQRDPSAPGYGSTLGRLFLRTLPNNFNHDSVYTWFPLMTPQAMKPILRKLGDTHLYDFNKPGVITEIPSIGDYRSVAEVLRSPDRFGAPQHARAGIIVSGAGFFIASDSAARGEREQRAMIKALTGTPDGTSKILDYFYKKTRDMMMNESWTAVACNTRNVDITRDVLKYVPIHWACEMVGIPLKADKDSDDDGFSPQEMWEMLSDVYTYLFLDVDQAQLLNLQEKSKVHVKKLLEYIKESSGGIKLSISGFINAVSNIFKKPTDHDELVARFAGMGYDDDTLANSLLALLVGSTVEMSQALTHLVNFFLDENKPTEVQYLASKRSFGSREESQLQILVLEALRIDPVFRGVYRDAYGEQKVGDLKIKGNSRLFVNIAKANLDPQAFPNPPSVNPSGAPRELYLSGDGCERCLGQDLATKIMAQVLRAVFSLPNLRRAPGMSGVLKRFPSDTMRTSTYVYLAKDQKQTPWATSMVVQFD
ncbi:linoleate diol synthase [Cristinia sonorae]|uniref:Linoleate diol synthase n=1 Tax=Cristinia sonorae TaxID=1940300 RepID=A0A8K0UV15_9AGAR|nr:linoleate diol synthase [Cristinia sonorae]